MLSANDVFTIRLVEFIFQVYNTGKRERLHAVNIRFT